MQRGFWKYRGVCPFEDSVFDNNFSDSAVNYINEDFCMVTSSVIGCSDSMGLPYGIFSFGKKNIGFSLVKMNNASFKNFVKQFSKPFGDFGNTKMSNGQVRRIKCFTFFSF
jgi:hypothetical protein